MKKKIIKPIIKFLLILILLVFLANLVILTQITLSEFTWILFWSNSINALLIGGSMAGGVFLISNYIEKKYPWLENPVRRLIFQLVYSVGYCLFIIVVTILVTKFIYKDNITWETLIGNSLFMVKVAIGFLLISMILTTAVQFFINWKKSEVIQERLKREQLDLQYETLKNQVNPHFLFNSLNSLTSLIMKNPDQAVEFTKKLSEVFRYVLDQKDNEIITIESELEFLESYIFLQKIRFGDNLTVHIDVEKRDDYIIPLSLQMLIENSIKHNVISKEFPLTIDVFQKGQDIIVVRNNLNKKSNVSERRGVGLENIRSRFEFFTSRKMEIEESELYFTVEIPLIKGKSKEM